MRPIPLALAALLPSVTAFADCQTDIAAAMRRANALPPTAGRAALLEQIQRADVARHEGDEGECADQLKDATSVLDSIDEAKKREAASHAEQTKAAPKTDQKSVGGQRKPAPLPKQ